MDVRSPLFKNIANLLTAVLLLNPVVSLAADLAVDASAGGNTQLGQAGNGVPVINIATPNGKGLSHNRFSEYNVGQQGLILNNATSATQATQLGGLIHGNANLADGPAGLILNEVTGSNPSQLKGYTEVAGQSAGVIVANPHGITCDGCGFINTPRATLSTGQPIIEDGRLSGFDVDQGEVAIEGAGLNASNLDQFDLITRSARINADLHANQLNIVTGRNVVDADTLAATAKTDDGSEKPLLAVDSSALGGMYAGAIHLVGTEQGVGVRLAGDMAASAGDIRIDANGQLSLGRMATAGDLELAGQSINLSESYAGGKVRLQADDLVDVTGSLASGGDMAVQTRELYNHGIMEAGIALDGSRQPDADIDIQVDHLGNAGLVVASGALGIQSRTLDNRSATLAAKSAVRITTSQLDNHDGQIIAEDELNLQAGSVSNAEGLLSAGQSMQVKVARDLDNRAGLINSNARVNISAAELDNRGGRVSAVEHLDITADSVNNSNLGTLSGQGSLAMKVGGQLDNHDEGAVVSDGAMQLSAGKLVNSASGMVVASGDLNLQVDNAIDNRTGTVVSSGELQLQAGGLDNRQGELSAGQTLQGRITGHVDNREGMLASGSLLELEAATLDNGDQGQLVSEGDISLRAAQMNNANGVLYARKEAIVRVEDQLDNSGGGRLIADGGMTLSAGELDNISGVVQATEGALALTLDGRLDNADGLVLAGNGPLTINADHVRNQDGVITSLKGLVHSVSRWFDNLAGNVQGENVSLQITETLNNDLGHIAATSGDLSLEAQRVSNMHGTLFARQLLSISAEQLNNNGSLLGLFTDASPAEEVQGWIVFYRQMLESDWDIFVADSIAQGLEPFLGDTGVTRQQELLAILDALEQHPDVWQQSSLMHGHSLDLNVDRLSQTVTSQMLAEDRLQGSGQNWTNHGFMASDGALDLALGGHYDSYGTLASIGRLDVRAGSLDLELGLEDIGGILGGADVNIEVSGVLGNSGQLTAMGDLAVQTGQLDNLGVLGAADQLQIVSDRLYNHLGLLFSGQNMLLQVDELVNHDADIYSLAGLRLSGRDPAVRAQRLDNVSGTIESAGNMLLNVDVLNNRKAFFHEEQVQLEGELTVRCYDCSGDHHNVDYIGREVFESRVLEDSPAALLHSGGQLFIEAAEVANQFSTLSASGDMLIRADTVQNLGAVGGLTERTRTWNTGRTTDGTDERFRWNHIYPYNAAKLPKQLPLEALARYNQVSDIAIVTALDANAPAVIQAGGNLVIEAAQNLENSRLVGNDLPAWHDDPTRNEIATALEDIIKVQINTQLPADLQQQQVNPLTLPGFSLPDGQQGLFRLVQVPAGSAPGAVAPSAVNAPAPGNHRYLIETNPALTDLGRFLGSEYLLGQLGLDPEQTLKRLGDALYEQRLMREAVTARTGARFLAGLTSDEAMYRYLMDNALASKEALSLRLGIALTAEQVAALTHDIVWLEEHEVMGEPVLVPVLYLAQAEGRLAPSGALIQGEDVTLISGGDLSNQGTLRASDNLGIVANNIDNSGLLQAHERVQLIAQNSIRNARGGIISGNDVALSAVGDIINERTATYYEGTDQAGSMLGLEDLLKRGNIFNTPGGSARDSGTILDNAARIEASGDLNIQAGGNLVNQGSVLQAGGDANLSAGQDLIIGSVEERSNSMRKDRRHHLENSQVIQHGSEVEVGGDLQAQAGKDISVIASQVEAGGDLGMSAQGDLIVTAAANEQHSEYRYRSSKKKITSERSLIDQQGAELVAGGNVSLIAGENLAVVASRIEATQEAYLVAGNQLALLAAEELDHSFYEKKKKGSFGRKSFRSDQTTRVTQQGTEITTGGDLALVSGGDQTYQAADLSSGADLTLTSGGAIAFEGVMDLDQERHEKSKSSWAWQSAKGKGSTDETLIQSQLEAQGDLVVRAVEGLQIDIREINQHSISETIDTMVAAEPGLLWMKEMEQRGDVDWRLVQEVHNSFDYSQSGLSGPAAMVIAIVVAYFTAGLASAFIGNVAAAGAGGSAALSAGGSAAMVTAGTAVGTASAGWANVALTSALTSAASGAAISGINNRGDLGAVIKEITSSDALKGYVTAGVTAGVTSGVLDQAFGVTGDNIYHTTKGFNLSNPTELAQFGAYLGAQGSVQAVAQTAVNGGSLGDNLQMALTNQVSHLLHATAFNAVGNVSATKGFADGSPEKIALHAMVGGMLSEATGGDFKTGALAAGANEALIEQLTGTIKGDRNLELAVSQLIGIAAATATGGDYAKAAELAKNATAYNRQLHPVEVRLIKGQADHLAEEQGISRAEAERRLAEAQAYFVDEQFRGTTNDKGVVFDEATLRHLGIALAPLAAQYDVRDSGDVPTISDSARVYSPQETLALLQDYHLNHAEAFRDPLMYGQYLSGLQGHEQRQFYEENLNYRQSDPLGALSGGAAGSAAAGLEAVQGFNELMLGLMNEPALTSEQISRAMLAAAANLDEVVSDYIQAKQDAELQGYLYRLQGDEASAAYVEEKWNTEFLLNFVAVSRAGQVRGGAKGNIPNKESNLEGRRNVTDGELIGQPHRFAPKDFSDKRQLNASDVNLAHSNNLKTDYIPYQNETMTTERYLQPGEKFFSVEFPGQASPGGWGTPKQYTSVEQARKELALLPEFKNSSGGLVIREYTVIRPTPVREGKVGGLKSGDGNFYEGGGDQIELLFDRGNINDPKWKDYISAGEGVFLGD